MTSPILYLAIGFRIPPDKGDRIRNWNVLRFLARHAPVWLACLADEPVPDATTRELNTLGGRVGVVPIGRSRWLRAAGAMLTGRSISEGAFDSPPLRQLVRDWTRGNIVRRRDGVGVEFGAVSSNAGVEHGAGGHRSGGCR